LIDGGIIVAITVAESDAAGAIGVDIGLALVLAIVKADIVTADRLPAAGLIELVAQRARLVRAGERFVRAKPEIADATALGEQHHRTRAAFGERDVADRRTVAGTIDVLG